MAEFQGTSYEEAVANAEKKLGAGRDALEIRVIQEGGTTGRIIKKQIPWRVEAVPKAAQPAAPAKEGGVPPAAAKGEARAPKDGGGMLIAAPEAKGEVKLDFTPEGVTITADPSLTDLEVASYIARRGVQRADLASARKQLAAGVSPVPLAPAQPEGPPAPDEIAVNISKDDMLAKIYLYPGDPDGERMTFDKARQILAERYKIVCGIDEEALRQIVDKRLIRQNIDIARGQSPQNGQDAKIEFHFRTDHSGRPKLLDGDRVDYRSLDLFESAKAGQVLVTRTPPGAGTDGMSLRGRVLKARPGRDRQLPRGKGVAASEDKLTLTAANDGVVTHVSGQVSVMSRYVVEGNVDMSTGNIEFSGDIEVRGNVISGMTLKADGNIEIRGVVEAAQLIAGGSVVLMQGMQGNDRGEVRAGGDVMAKYVERVKISAGGVVTADAIYHSEVNAVEGVMLAGKHASLIGGVARSARQVAARTIGSNSQTATIVEVGIMPEQRARFNELEASLRGLAAERDKLALLVKSFGGAPKPDEPPDRTAMRERVLEANRQLFANIAASTAERDQIRAEMEAVTGGKVHVTGTVFPGTRVVIGSAVSVIDSQIDYATFRASEGEVAFGSCEL